jgi:O-antigen/teichoic acid export membrane protein
MAQRSIFGEIRKLVSQSVIYGLGTYSTRVLGFFLIPVYTRYLAPPDYGILGLANMASNLLFIVLNFGQSTAFFRSYYDFDDEEGRKAVVTTSVILTLGICGPLCGLLILFAGPIADFVFGAPAYAGIFIVACLGSAANVFLRVPFAMMRAEEKATRYATLSAARGLTGMVLALILVVGLGWGAAGVVWSQFASQFVFLVALLPAAVWGLRWTFTTPVAGQLLSFGSPYVFAGLSTFILNLSDRFFLKHYTSLSEVGIYSLACSFGEILVLLLAALRIAYSPFVYSNMKSPDAPRLYARVLTYYVTGMGFIALCVSLLAKETIAIMAAPSYHAAATVVPLLAVAQFFHGFSFMAPIGIAIQRRPIFRTVSVLIAAGINLGLNFLLIPKYGMMGAAWSTVVAFIVESAFITGFSLHFYPLPLEVGRMVRAVVVAGGLYTVGTWIPEEVGIAAAFALKALIALGFFDSEEVQHAGTILRSVKLRLGLAAQRS